MPIRVLIAAMPEMLHDIIEDVVAQQPALEVVARLQSHDDVIEAAHENRADVFVMHGNASSALRLTRDLLFARPRMRVLVLSHNGRTAHMHRLLPHELVIEDVSPGDLVNAMLANGDVVI